MKIFSKFFFIMIFCLCIGSAFSVDYSTMINHEDDIIQVIKQKPYKDNSILDKFPHEDLLYLQSKANELWCLLELYLKNKNFNHLNNFFIRYEQIMYYDSIIEKNENYKIILYYNVLYLKNVNIRSLKRELKAEIMHQKIEKIQEKLVEFKDIVLKYNNNKNKATLNDVINYFQHVQSLAKYFDESSDFTEHLTKILLEFNLSYDSLLNQLNIYELKDKRIAYNYIKSEEKRYPSFLREHDNKTYGQDLFALKQIDFIYNLK